MKRFVAIAALLSLIAVSCGDDDATDGNDPLVTDFTEQITAGRTSDQFGFTDEDAVCFAGGLIDELGGERIAGALDLEFEEFMAGASDQERKTVVDVLINCADFASLLTAEFSQAISGDSARCLGDAFVASEGFRAALADSFGTGADPLDDEELMGEMLPVMFDCLSAEELIELGSS
jgi:hypothetical protein